MTEDSTQKQSLAVDGACCAVVDHELAEWEVTDDVEIFTALANDTRYEILRLLSAAGGEVCACNLVPSLGVSQSATSQALTKLYRAGLVKRRKEGRWRYYQTTTVAEQLLGAVDTVRNPK